MNLGGAEYKEAVIWGQNLVIQTGIRFARMPSSQDFGRYPRYEHLNLHGW